jgi:fucose 4-O-acetylase-like acetyltransferase
MKERESWVDIAKGISIFLLIMWHSKVNGGFVVHYINSLNEGLIFLRMPLFFFVSGFFINKSFNVNFSKFLDKKIYNLVYLYFLWGNLLVFSYNIIREKVLILHNPFEVFYNPPPTFWFLFALAIGMVCTYFVSMLPYKYGLVLMIFVYLIFSYNAQWRSVDFITRTGRLVPFMYFGFILFPYLNIILKKTKKLGVLVITIPFFCYFVMFSSLSESGLVTLLTSLFSIFILCCFCSLISEYKIREIFLQIGKNSLYVYVLHRFVLFGVSPINNLFSPILFFLLSITLCIIVPIFIQRNIIKGSLNYLFNIKYSNK